MDDVKQLEKKLADYTTSLYKEGILDEQFKQLQLLQDETNPDFVVEVVNLFFKDSERLLNELHNTLNQQNMDFKKLDAHVHHFKGSSSSIGAQRVRKVCIAFRDYCVDQNIEECLKCLQLLNNECSLVKTKLEVLLNLEKQVVGCGGSIPNPMD